MWTNVSLVYRKDLREIFRDRRILVRLFLMSVLWPPLMGHFLAVYGKSFTVASMTESLQVGITGAEYLPSLASEYSTEKGFQRVDLLPGESLTAATKAGRIAVGLEIPQDAAASVAAGRQVEIGVYYDNVNSKQQIILDRVRRPIVAYNERQRDLRLTLLGVSGPAAKRGVLEPIVANSTGVADRRQEVGQLYGGAIAYFAFLTCFMGCTFAAMALGVGEKERGTLESLLLLPASRRDLILGKYLVVMTIGGLYSTLLLVSIAIWLRLEAVGSSGITDELMRVVGLRDLLLVWLMLLLVAAIFAAALLALSVYAKSFREASGFTALFNMVIVVAVLFAILPGIELGWGTAAVPITNVALAIRELLKGTMPYALLALIAASSMLIAVMLLAWCKRMFEREAVIFRE